MLEVTKKVVFEVDYNDLDEAITTFLKSKSFTNKNFDKHGYECVAENEWCNDQSHTFTVSAKLPEGYALNQLNDSKEPDTGTILNWMCADGLIEEGEYLVDVCW